MATQQQADVAVVGAGIVGLAFAHALAQRGLRVVVFERSARSVGASIRNFGLVWPIGQPAGPLTARALRSRAIWLDIAVQAGFWCAANGSLHLAYHQDELDVLVEYLESTASASDYCELLTADAVLQRSPAARTDGLRGALWSSQELNVDPRQAIRAIPPWLSANYGVAFHFGTIVHGVALPHLETSSGTWRVNQVLVCSGADFETLYPAVFAASEITRCKLQMLRTVPQPAGWQLGPSLCGGLTLLHYAAFRHCRSLATLRQRYENELPDHIANRIHVLLSQTARGELTIGDHHEYGLHIEPFDREDINRAILRYLHHFAHFPNVEIAERWHGVYALIPGRTELVVQPETGVTIVNALGGAGMTLSFGLAEEVVERL